MKVLVAEDDTLSRMMLEKCLQRSGYDVTAVSNGERALATLGFGRSASIGVARLDHAGERRHRSLP